MREWTDGQSWDYDRQGQRKTAWKKLGGFVDRSGSGRTQSPPVQPFNSGTEIRDTLRAVEALPAAGSVWGQFKDCKDRVDSLHFQILNNQAYAISPTEANLPGPASKESSATDSSVRR